MNNENQYLVAVIGAGPAGLYAAQYLARQGVQVVLFNRDIKPGGLAEYGIFPEKHKMRSGLMAHFSRILEMPFVKYQGNITVGQGGDIKLDRLRRAGFQAFMVTTGAQQDNWVGLPGEDLEGVVHANRIVFHYNQMPGFGDQPTAFGREVAVIGVGNVMLDIVNYIMRNQQNCTVTAYGRRGPTEVKFDIETLEPVAGCLDLDAIKQAVDESSPAIEQVGKNIQDFLSLLAGARQKSIDCDSKIRFMMKFLRTPRRLIGDRDDKNGIPGRVKAIEFEINQLVCENGEVVSRGTGETEIIPADTVIFSIGSHVDPGFGLPVGRGNYLTSSNPRFPVDGISYEAYNPDLCIHCEDIFVSGWARLASEGIVGLARKDAERGAKALMQYLQTLQPLPIDTIAGVLDQLPLVEKRAVDSTDLKTLREAERSIADEKGRINFKFDSNEAMLEIIERGS